VPKEKPKIKTPIPGTDWLRVTTNQGNVFYTNKAKKESVWTVPDEIKDAVELLNKTEEDEKVQAEKESQEKAQRDAAAEQEREIERIKMEVQEVVKRKAEDVSPSDESIISKKPRMRDHVEDEPEEGEGTEDDQEEDWQREAAAQLAKEAEEEKKRQQEEAEAVEAAQKAKEGAPKIPIPDHVDLSIEEGKALFKVCSQCGSSPRDPFTRVIRRPYSGRRTSTRYIRGIRRFHYSFPIHAMYSFPPSPHVARPLTSTVESVLAKFEHHGSRRRRRIPRKSLSDCSQRR
jgi:hypothetical protein